jgi:hypothetical protein
MKFIGVIGQRNAGKSTIIRALTACKTVGFRGAVHDRKTKQWIEVIASSPQERDMPNLAAKIRSAANDPNCLGIVAALQPSHPRKHILMEEVFKIAQEHRAKCYAFAISQPHNKNKSYGVEIANLKARLVRSRIRLTEPIQSLDARRFAYLNAEIIQKTVALF